MRQSRCNCIYSSGFRDLHRSIGKSFNPYISTPTQGAWQIRWSGLSISPVIVSLTTSPRVYSQSIGKKTWLIIFPWENETLSKLVGHLTSQQVTNSMSSVSNVTPHKSQNNYNSNHLWQDTKTTRIDLETFEISLNSPGVEIKFISDLIPGQILPKKAP